MSRVLNILAALLLSTVSVRAQDSSSTSSVAQTKNYIDTISGYNELSSCAVRVLSTIVRDEISGCQDTYALTSYTCFCTDSSSFFSAAISRDVVAGCGSSAAQPQATSALGVFDAYCALGVAAGLVTQQNSPTSAGSASPAATASTTQATGSASTSPSQGQSGTVSLGVAVGVGVGVAVGVIGLAFVTWFVWRRRHRKAKETRAQLSQPQYMTAAGGMGYGRVIKVGDSSEMPTYEHHVREVQGHGLSEAPHQQVGEFPGYYRPHELSGSYPQGRSNE